MALPRALKNFVLFVDGGPQVGVVDELELPELAIKTEEHRAGGMDAPVEIDLGQDAMTASFRLADYREEVLRLWGLADGNATGVTARGALQRDGEPAVPVVAVLRGGIKTLDWPAWRAGEKAGLQITLAVRYYKLTIGGREMIEIDVENMVRRIDGRDQLDSVRTAIGL